MSDYRFTDYFEREVLRKRPYIQREWCVRVVASPLRAEPQGTLVGIDIDNASRKLELQSLVLSRLPGEVYTSAA